MQVFTKILRVLFNSVLVRGKRRIPRIILVVFLSALVFTVYRHGFCLFSSSMCPSSSNGDTGHIHLRDNEHFDLNNIKPPAKHLLPNSLSKTANLIDSAQANPNFDLPQVLAHDDSDPETYREDARNDHEEDALNDDGEEEDGVELNQSDENEIETPLKDENVVKDSDHQSRPSDEDPDNGEGELAQPPEEKSPKEKIPQRTVKIPGAGDSDVEQGLDASQVTTTEHAQNETAVNSTEVDEYEEEEESEELGELGDQMSPEEVAEALRSGAMCKSVCPPFRWSKWSPCSKACGRGRRYRKAIYDFVCPSTNFCPQNRIEESVCETPCKFDPDKYGGPDGLDLYPVNPLNPIIYMDKYGCGNWLVEYEKIHNEIVAGRRSPQFLVYSTGKGDYPTAGGISGRLKGITTVFFMAVLLERAFIIEWEDPPGITDYVQPKSFDWANTGPIQGRKRGPIRDIASWKAAKDDGHSSQWYMNTNFTRYFKYPVERIQGARYDFTYALLRNPELMPKAYEYGIDRIKCRLCCAWDMLFKMAPKFEEEMNTLLKSIGYPTKPLLALQVRAKSDNIEEAVKVAEHNVNCGQKASRDLKLSPVYVPIFNNRLVVHIVAKKYKRLMKTPIEIETATRTVHTHLGNLPADTELEVAKGVQERTFKEFFLMLNSTVLIRTKGYLGSMANVADAIRRHYAMHGKRVYTYTAGGTSCSPVEDGTKIE